MSGKLRENMQMSEKLYINEKNRQKHYVKCEKSMRIFLID